MKYNDLKTLLTERKIKIADFAAQLKMTRQGLQRSLDSDLLPAGKVLLCCKLLGMSPDEFFGWEPSTPTIGVYASNISGVNTQNSNEAIKALKDQLKEKDKQISRLLTLLEKQEQTARMNDGGYHSLAAESPVQYPVGKGQKPPQK